MPSILAIHGVGQQSTFANLLHRDWWPEIAKGLKLAGAEQFGPEELSCPYYGDLFLRHGVLSNNEMLNEEDMDGLDEELMMEMWQFATLNEPDRVISPAAYASDRSLTSYHPWLQSAANSLLSSRYFSGMAKGMMLGDLKQVNRYINDRHLRDQAVERVTSQLGPEIRVVIGHSLGSVVAYEALCCCPHHVDTFITLGSPLGIKKLIFDQLQPAPVNDVGQWPGVNIWLNVADSGDLVAMKKKLASFFGERVEDLIVDNGWKAHDGTKYMGQKEIGAAVAKALCQKN
ncbi:hypothetical protein ACFJIV_12715 [Mucilaginibacter sp. UC70_90]